LCKIVHFFCPNLSFFEESVHFFKLNTDQEQRERIQEFRDIKRYLETEQPPQEHDSETLNIDFNEILKDSANFTKTTENISRR
jgi:hypothetical protein